MPLPYKFLIASFFISLSLTAQNSFRGQVMDGNLPLQGATIVLINHNTTLVSDSSGKFHFSGSSNGHYHLLVSMVGYEVTDLHINWTERSKPLIVNLRPANQSLNEVVITGTMRQVQRLESPVAVEVFSQQYFKKNPSPSIFESLQMVNGVRPQINCSVCNTGDIHINGLEGPYTMVTIDGMPLVSSLSSVYGLFGIPNSLLEKVEIIKGPASGLYGSEAIGGLINIITKDPQKAPKFSVQAMSTSWLENNLDLGFGFGKKNLSSLLGLHYYQYGQPQDENGDGFTDVTLQHRISIFNKWKLNRANDKTATLAARYFYEDRWGGDMRWNKSFRGGDSIYGESIYTKRFEVMGNYQLPMSIPVSLSFSGTVHNQDSYYGTTPYMADQKILFGQLVWMPSVSGQHALLAGLAGRYNYYNDNSTATQDTLTGKDQADKNFLPGVFLQDEWELNRKHKLLAGLRYDYHSIHGPIFTPRVAYKWTISDRSILRLNSGTGFRVVNLFTEDHAALTGARDVEIRNELEPEKSYNLNVNYILRLGKSTSPVQLDATGWYTYFHNQIVADYDIDPNKIIYDNLDGYAISKGFSLNSEFRILRKLKGNVGVTIQDVSVVKEISGKEIRTRPVLTESFSGTWALTWELPQIGVLIDYTGNIYGPMRLPLISDKDPRKPYSPVWSVQNIQLTKSLSKGVEIFGGIKNLLNWTPAKGNPFLIARTHDPFDKKVKFDANGNVEETAENPYKLTFDPNYVYAPNQGLRIFAGFKWNLVK
jgi:outer membrane receptor for ferrienterochelin and colicins